MAKKVRTGEALPVLLRQTQAASGGLLGILLEADREGVKIDPLLRRIAEALIVGENLTDAGGRHIFCEKHPRTGRLIVRYRKKPPKPLWKARCGATTRKGLACRCRPEPGRTRCKWHGGNSTGPRTPEGRVAIAESNRKRAMAKRILDTESSLIKALPEEWQVRTSLT